MDNKNFGYSEIVANIVRYLDKINEPYVFISWVVDVS